MLGIIGAMPEEVELLHEAMEDKKEFRRAGLGIYKGCLLYTSTGSGSSAAEA